MRLQKVMPLNCDEGALQNLDGVFIGFYMFVLFLERRISEVCVKEGTRFVLRASAFIIKNNKNFNFVIHLF